MEAVENKDMETVSLLKKMGEELEKIVACCMKL